MSATVEKPTTNGVYLSAEYPNPTPPDTDPPPPPKAPAAPVPVLDRAAAQVARVAAKDGAGVVLAGVCIRNGEAAAANRFMLAVCPLPKRSPDDFAPEYAPVDPGPADVLLPAKAVTAIAGKRIPARDNLKHGMGMVYQGQTPISAISDHHAILTVPTEHGFARSEVRTITGTYPDYDAVFLEGEPVVSFTLNAELVIDMMEMYVAAMKATGYKGDRTFGGFPVAFHYYGPQNGIVLAGNIDRDRTLDAMLMPIIAVDPSEPSDATARPRVGTGKVPKPKKQPRLDGASVVMEGDTEGGTAE